MALEECTATILNSRHVKIVMAEPQLSLSETELVEGKPEQSIELVPAQAQPVVIIVGSGPVGVHCAQQLIERGFEGTIKLFGDEPWRPYNRIKLSSLVAGEVTFQDILLPEIGKEQERFHFIHQRISKIDSDKKQVVDERGNSYSYDELVFCTGSSPWLPNVQGIDLNGVYVFRNLNDAQKLMARSVRTRRTVVVGGGLLGLEAAKAMQRNNTHVILVHQSNRLMNRQLDIEAGAILKRTVEGYGIEVMLNAGVRSINGEHTVESVELPNGKIIECDTVIFATGIQPNAELARKAGVSVGRGILVNDELATNQAGIHAVGECAEYNGEIYGLLAPGIEQAAVLADRICGGDSHYRGSIAATQLKILDLPIFTVGWVGDEYENLIDQTVIYQSKNGDYRKLFLKRNRVKGVVAVGACAEKSRLQQAVTKEMRLMPWHISRFKNEGRIWPEEDTAHVREWPATALVCNCRGIEKGTLVDAQLGGCQTVEALAQCTGASTVCGSCKPLLADLVGTPVEPEPVLASGKPLRSIVVVSLILAALALIIPGPSYSESYQTASWLESFWTDSLLKQITGYSLLGISVAGILISLRKRITKFTLGGFPWWRFIHTVLGFLALVILYLHTGFELGSNLNRYLMMNFILLAVAGALAGIIIASEATSRMGYTGKQVRQWLTHSHIVLFWLLPMLLGLHVLSVYFF